MGEFSKLDGLYGQRLTPSYFIGVLVESQREQLAEKDKRISELETKLAKMQAVVDVSDTFADYVVRHPQLVTQSVSDMALTLTNALEELAAH